MDLVLKLREIRRMRGLSQRDVARRSGVGEKTISSFETGERIGSLKLSQLHRLLAVYGLTEVEFFSASIENQIAPWDRDENEMAKARLLDNLCGLPQPLQLQLLAKFQLMIETITEMTSSETTSFMSPMPRAVSSVHAAAHAGR
jgi:transcriptional regulator with XRE-family HTH domain